MLWYPQPRKCSVAVVMSGKELAQEGYSTWALFIFSNLQPDPNHIDSEISWKYFSWDLLSSGQNWEFSFSFTRSLSRTVQALETLSTCASDLLLPMMKLLLGVYRTNLHTAVIQTCIHATIFISCCEIIFIVQKCFCLQIHILLSL